jgi:hypothetical protein
MVFLRGVADAPADAMAQRDAAMKGFSTWTLAPASSGPYPIRAIAIRSMTFHTDGGAVAIG